MAAELPGLTVTRARRSTPPARPRDHRRRRPGPGSGTELVFEEHGTYCAAGRQMRDHTRDRPTAGRTPAGTVSGTHPLVRHPPRGCGASGSSLMGVEPEPPIEDRSGDSGSEREARCGLTRERQGAFRMIRRRPCVGGGLGPTRSCAFVPAEWPVARSGPLRGPRSSGAPAACPSGCVGAWPSSAEAARRRPAGRGSRSDGTPSSRGSRPQRPAGRWCGDPGAGVGHLLAGCQIGVAVVLVAGRAEPGTAKCTLAHVLSLLRSPYTTTAIEGLVSTMYNA